jgi:uncharacterized membrane-anchored protein YhcB (DUF1043 family)
MISWFWFFSVLVALIAGFAISVYLNRKTDTEHKLKQEFDSLNLEYQNYQNQVRAHFNRTSELLAEYQQQHQHLQAHIFSAAQGFGNIHSSEFGSMSTNDSISKTDYVSPHLLRNKTFDFEQHDFQSNLDDELEPNLEPDSESSQDSNFSNPPRDYVTP